MTKKIAWAISGAGCWLIESFALIGKILHSKKHKVDLFFSCAGREVSQCYGVFKPPIPSKESFITKVREIPNFNEDFFQEGFIKKYQWTGISEEVIDEEILQTPIKKKIKKVIDETIAIDEPQQEEYNYKKLIHDVIFESDEGYSFPTAASASIDKYDLVIISPATGNTVSKLANGIADSLLTNLGIMASKSPTTKIIVLPTDYQEGKVKSYLPIMLNSDFCKKCSECSALWACKPGAIRRKRSKIRLNRLLCTGCLECVRYCRYGVISFLEETTVVVQKREAAMAQKLAKHSKFTVVKNPQELHKIISKELPI
jgi:dihydromethanopterin reductase (acceptor)